jgi:hypothetical protein
MDIWVFYLILAAIPGVILFAVAYKLVEVRRARSWPSTPGRVVASGTEALPVPSGGPRSTDTELRNFARVEYVYTVGGREYRCDRVSIGENTGNFEVPETSARYPVGKAVTVYYDPANPEQAVLERELPSGVGRGLAIFVGLIAALVGGGVLGYYWLLGVVQSAIGNPARAPFVTACLGFAVVAAMMALAFNRYALQTRRWPRVPGQIESASVKAFQERKDDGPGWRTHYRPEIVYSYVVEGVRYTGDKASRGVQSSSTMEAPARRRAARYAPGSTVPVYYNPENPAESVLNPGSWAPWLVWLIPAIVLAIAIVASR